MAVIVIMIYPILHILHKVNSYFKKNFYILVNTKVCLLSIIFFIIHKKNIKYL